MNRIKRFIQMYYTRALYTQGTFDFFIACCLFICVLTFGLYWVTPNKPFSDNHEKLTYLIVAITSAILLILNYIGKRNLYGSKRHIWLKVPYISSLYIILLYWLHQIFSVDANNRKLVILFPIIFPIISWIFQFILMDRLLKPEQEKTKALLLSVPIAIVSILGLLFATADVFGIFKDPHSTYLGTFVLGFFNMTIPPYFTATSEYWHPELKQSRYDEAMGALQQTKKSKKTGKKKKKKKLKK